MFFLDGRDSGVDPGVLDEVDPGGLVLELFDCGTCDADVVFVEEGGIQRF